MKYKPLEAESPVELEKAENAFWLGFVRGADKNWIPPEEK